VAVEAARTVIDSKRRRLDIEIPGRNRCRERRSYVLESHLRFILKSWIAHYNGGRPQMALGPGARSRLRDIVAENRMPFEPHQSLVDCIMITRSRLLSRERHFFGRQQ
jgi:hypothetical protein